MLRSLFRFRFLRSRLLGIVLAVGAVVGVSLPAAPEAAAASLTQITNFGTNPSNLLMYLYVPNNVKPNPPILLALHGCQGTGPYLYSSTDFGKLADQYGFIVIYPSTNPSGSCWDVSSNQALTRNGGSDPVGLMSMITYTEQHYGGNPNAVYVTGESSGGMMTNVMLADYPDVFKAGAAFMGVPYHCFYTGTVRGWNGSCAGGQVSMSPQQWGDLVRNDAYPGYTGPRPRVQLWHGTADTTLNYNNLGEEIKQWTNVLGVSQTPSSSDTPVTNWNRTRYNDSSGTTQVEAYSIAGAGHQLPIQGTQMAAYAIHFMGLDGSGSTGGNTVTVTNPGNQTAASGTPINTLQIHATDSASGQTLTYSATGLPPGLVISSSGLITGTPTSGGSFSTTVRATDPTGATGSTTFTWTVSGAGSTGALRAVGAGKCLDDPNSTATLGTQQQIYSCNGQANQTWTHDSSKELTVTVGGSTLCLDANGQGTTNGTKAVIWSCNGQANQQWNLNSNGTITGVQSGLCLDVTGAGTANGALVELWSCNGGGNQQWTLG
ncbi:extracellular catalytic domain type 1 short-chain-length polyhydroxyalkanoate depolymerase [Actinoallomurus rhizosphaericola]|uniref:extracellular catalytic domain type 1 short-chain-length polyhydroxyalkanoate depolymerase n=1 Tax=Actinoallomurus rhizosphaericola TaxID=2952536 RepID=UPI002091E7BD|nr:PHB depolymerase family esterase [Actinoallomurus rhizosphaericola]MCO6000073.1 PHB depolymerase family esterase [Actinoallomurus rhizosphaericola]